MKIGMGWVGWTEAETLATDMQSIEAAYRGCHERLCAVAGKQIPGAKVETTTVEKSSAMTSKLFRAMFSRKK